MAVWRFFLCIKERATAYGGNRHQARQIRQAAQATELTSQILTSLTGVLQDIKVTLKNIRGRTASLQASPLRTMMLEAHNDPTKILAHVCSYDGMSSRLVEESGQPMIFLAGYTVASSYGLPDTGYIAMQEMCDKIQDAVRQTSVPVMAVGDTGTARP
jgi:hypothetical protein